MSILRLLVVSLAIAVLGVVMDSAHAYIEETHTFGKVVAQSSNVVLMRVEAVDKEKNLIIYRKIRDVKGVHPTEVIKHNIGRGGLRPNEWKPTMDWAEPGKIAVFFYNGGASETCIGNYWYQAYAGGEWWNHSHGEPFLLRTYCGPPEKLPALVKAVMDNQEVIVPCMVDGNKEDLHNRTAKIQRLKASLKIQDYNPKRDFVGWGGEEFRRVLGMPGFTHMTALARTDPDAQSISVVDFDNDGKPDVCLVGGGKLLILQNNGESMSEVMLPGVNTARSALWADYNGDGLPDCLVVATSGPRLYTNLGKGNLRDDSHLLPQEPAYQLTAAAWADIDADGKPDLILGNGYHGLRVYHNIGLKLPSAPAQPRFGPWSYLGPIEYDQQRGFESSHPAEKINLKESYLGKHKRKIAWKTHNFNDGAINPLGELFPPDSRDWVAVYLHRTINVDSYTEIPVSFGSDDTLAVWIDGKKIISANEHRACTPDSERAVLKLDAGKHDLLIRIGQGNGGFEYYFNWTKPERPVAKGVAFENVTAKVLGAATPLADAKYDSLVVHDVNGDGRPDFLYGNRLFLATATPAKSVAYVESPASGLDFAPHRASPVFGDFDGDGVSDLFVPQKTAGKLFKGDGTGKFTDVTAKAGDLAGAIGWTTSAAWGDVDNDGKLDLIVGCFKGPNRFFKGRGDGTFEDATEKIGLEQKIFNTQAVSCVDLNGDGQLDFVFNNEGQDSAILLGSGALAAGKKLPLTLRLESKSGVTGSQVRVLDKAGKVLAAQQLSGGDGRGSQQAPFARFALDPGVYQVQVRLSDGALRSREFTIGESPVRGVIVDEKAP